MPVQKYSEIAIISFVLGLVGGFSFYLVPFLGIIIPALAIIFGIMALIQIKKNKKLKGKTLSLFGIIFGIISLIVVLVYILTPKIIYTFGGLI